MCFKTKVPEPPKIQNAPSRDEAADAGLNARRRLVGQSGVGSNIFTTALGDPNYGKAAVSQKLATLGA